MSGGPTVRSTTSHYVHTYVVDRTGTFTSVSLGTNLQFSFSSRFPREVMERARMNSSNSMAPSWFSSKTRKTKEANLVGSPLGKNCVYILMKPCSVRRPLGQSFKKPLCHCLISFSVTATRREREIVLQWALL